ncbi:hypothetical protein ACLB2K_063620 [Fragaria x ananassa]
MGSSGVCWEVLCVGGVDLIFWLTRENPPPSPPSLAPPLSAATSTHLAASHYSQGWINAAKFLTGASTVGSLAIPIILRHAHMIETSAMWIEFVSFFIFVCTVMCFHRASLEDEW